MIAAFVPIAIVAAGLPAEPQQLGAIRGRVEIRDSRASMERRPNVSELGGPPVPPAQDLRRSVIFLETAPRAAFEYRDDGRARMDQRNESFTPGVLAITAGTTVDFPNNDRTYHNVFSLSKARRFDLGRYAAGRSKSVQFNRPGIVRVFCEIHSHMSAFILVFGHRFFAVTDPEGRYRIENVPPGSYAVTVWDDGATRETRRVIIPEERGEIELNFEVGRTK